MAKLTKKQMILNHLKRGWSITPHQAKEKYRCMSLSQRIGDLIQEGHNIHRGRIKTEDGYCGYYKLIKAAG